MKLPSTPPVSRVETVVGIRSCIVIVNSLMSYSLVLMVVCRTLHTAGEVCRSLERLASIELAIWYTYYVACIANTLGSENAVQGLEDEK